MILLIFLTTLIRTGGILSIIPIIRIYESEFRKSAKVTFLPACLHPLCVDRPDRLHKEVVREVVITPAAGPTQTVPPPTSQPQETQAGEAEEVPAEERVFKIGIAEDMTTPTTGPYLGPDGSIWNSYVLGGSKPALYGYSAQRYDWIPSLAADFPEPLAETTKDGTTFWTTQLALKEGVKRSDGSEVTADDFVFTATTAVELQLTGNWPSIVDPEYFDHAEADGPYSLTIYFKQKARPGPAGPVRPGLHAHLLQGILGTGGQRRPASGRRDGATESVVRPRPRWRAQRWRFRFRSVGAGRFCREDSNREYYFSGSTIEQYSNGAYWRPSPAFMSSPPSATRWRAGTGVRRGPIRRKHHLLHLWQPGCRRAGAQERRHRLMLNPLGLSSGLQEQLQGENGLTTIENASNGVRYLGFNFRKEPMDNKAFRQAVATLIDKEFLVDTVLQGVAIPIYTMVPEGNGAWYKPGRSPSAWA